MKKIHVFSVILLIILIVSGTSLGISKAKAQAFATCTDIGGSCMPANECLNDILQGGACFGGGTEVCCSYFASNIGSTACFTICTIGWQETGLSECTPECLGGETCCEKITNREDIINTEGEIDQGEIDKKEYGIYNMRDILTEAIEISNKLLGIVGSVALLFFIVAGVKMIFSGGSEEKIGSARTMMVQTIIGLVIFLSAYLIVSFIQDTLIKSEGLENNYKLNSTNF
jgi:type IV secretion system pilin